MAALEGSDEEALLADCGLLDLRSPQWDSRSSSDADLVLRADGAASHSSSEADLLLEGVAPAETAPEIPAEAGGGLELEASGVLSNIPILKSLVCTAWRRVRAFGDTAWGRFASHARRLIHCSAITQQLPTITRQLLNDCFPITHQSVSNYCRLFVELLMNYSASTRDDSAIDRELFTTSWPVTPHFSQIIQQLIRKYSINRERFRQCLSNYAITCESLVTYEAII